MPQRRGGLAMDCVKNVGIEQIPASMKAGVSNPTQSACRVILRQYFTNIAVRQKYRIMNFVISANLDDHIIFNFGGLTDRRNLMLDEASIVMVLFQWTLCSGRGLSAPRYLLP
jgi:hypothetical protein